jgi:uncharacterized protein (DUF39 family)
MEIKYNLLETINKTQKANKLCISNNLNKYAKNMLFDFFLLEKHITDNSILQEIKNQCFNSCNGVTDKFVYVHAKTDIFESFDYYSGNLYFKPYTVYSNSKNKRVYTIMELVKIEYLTFQERSSLYREFNKTLEINDQIGFNNILEDIEIA